MLQLFAAPPVTLVLGFLLWTGIEPKNIDMGTESLIGYLVFIPAASATCFSQSFHA